MNEESKPQPKTILRELMVKSGYKTSDIAAKTGIHPGTVYRVLNGVHSISPRMAKELSKLFNVEPDYLLSLNKGYIKRECQNDRSA